MKQTLTISSNGVLQRKNNTLYFHNDEIDKQLPIHNIKDINCFGKVSLTSGASSLLLKEGVIVNFFNYYGYYEGSLYPRIQLNSGELVVNQVLHYYNSDKREYIAKEFVKGIQHNILKTLKYYRKKRGVILDIYIHNIEKETIGGNIHQIMSSEGRIWDNFYQSFNIILRKFNFKQRKIRPPTDEINSLLSYGNTILYSTVLSEIYQTYLHPSISYLHEPSYRRFSLSLDIADIFKPVIVDRIIFKLVNNNEITKKHFHYNDDGAVLLNDKGKKIFTSEYYKKLETTLKHPKLNKHVSYQHLIKLECYKLINHLNNKEKYESFKLRW